MLPIIADIMEVSIDYLLRGDVSAGGSIECKNVTGDVSVGNNVKLVCADIDGDVHMETEELHCKKIRGDVKCSGNIYYDK